MGFLSNVITTPTAASLSLDEAASFLGVHPVTLQGLAKSGEATVSGLQSLLDEIKPNATTHLTRRSLE